MLSSSASISVAFFAAVASVAWSAAYAWGKWLAHRHDVPPTPTSSVKVDDQRIMQLEAAIEALAVEIERVGEGQRYATQLLAQRLPSAIEPPGQSQFGNVGRVITPH